jgi:hypothetical protein
MAKYLYVGPVSREVLQAASNVARHELRLRLCCSEGQVGPNSYTGIRVTDLSWSHLHTHAERDHAGRDGKVLDAIERWNKIESRTMDGIHVHSYDLTTKPRVKCDERDVQIGPGEDDSRIMRCDKETSDWTGWVSFPAGPHIAGGQNVGVIDERLVASFRTRYPKARLRLHNADFMSRDQWRVAARLFDGINIAPMLGVLQSVAYITRATANGLDYTAWEKASYEDIARQLRWGVAHPSPRWYHVGHYHFDKIPWRDEVRVECVEMMTNTIQEIMTWLDP